MASPTLSASPVPAATFDALRWQRHAQRYLRQRGVPAAAQADLLHEMLVLALEHPERWHNVEYVYKQAWDRLDPRTTCLPGDTYRPRKSERFRGPSLDAPLSWDADDSGTLHDRLAVTASEPRDPLAQQWLLRHLAQLDARTAYIVQRYYWDDVPMRQIGTEVGLTESRISMLLTQTLQQWRHAPRARVQRAPWAGWTLRWEVQWLTMH